MIPNLVRNRKGDSEPFDFTKIYSTIKTAAFDLEGIDIDRITNLLSFELYENITTKAILDSLIKITNNFVTLQEPDYQYLAGRMLLSDLRREAYGGEKIPHLSDHVKKLVNCKLYDSNILKMYSESELDILNNHLHHDRDLQLAFAAVSQFKTKYLVCNRSQGICYESPQMAYMLIGACAFINYPTNSRLNYVLSFYEAISTHKINLPTPIISGLRTGCYQMSSCVLIDVDDNMPSIVDSGAICMKYICQRAGIGLNIGRLRPINSTIKNGAATHTGLIPFIKYFQAAIKSCSQGGVRSGSGTVFYPIWHLEIVELLQLKNNRGSEDNRARHLDYGVQISRLFYYRFINNLTITLFSPKELPELYEAFFANQQLFEEIYLQAENSNYYMNKKISARELFSSIAIERSQTGRIYIQNVDHCNDFSSFNNLAPSIKGSNLCTEITLPTVPVGKENMEIALCTLSAINLGKIDNLHELDPICDLVVRFLDNILDLQHYPVEQVKITSQQRRSLGIGVTNFAYFLAKRGYKYGSLEARNLTHEMSEALQYYLLQASANLAKEKGPCAKFQETKYSNGILPIDNYRHFIDTFHNSTLNLPWEQLRAKIAKFGLRNSTLSAQMPCESSSVISNSTNGIEAPRNYIITKVSKGGPIKMVLEDALKLSTSYQMLWDLDVKDALVLSGIMQKFFDQSISTNTHYDPSKYKNNLVPISDILGDILFAYKLGIKTLYYHNTREFEPNTTGDDCGCTI